MEYPVTAAHQSSSAVLDCASRVGCEPGVGDLPCISPPVHLAPHGARQGLPATIHQCLICVVALPLSTLQPSAPHKIKVVRTASRASLGNKHCSFHKLAQKSLTCAVVTASGHTEQLLGLSAMGSPLPDDLAALLGSSTGLAIVLALGMALLLLSELPLCRI